MTRPRLGVLTIGQSPRVDLVPEMLAHLHGIEVVERGALDGMTAGQIADLAPAEATEQVLTTRLADGTPVVLDHDVIPDLIQRAVDDLEEKGVDAIVVVCTGRFPPLRHRRPLLTADILFRRGARASLDPTVTTLGVLSPLEEQRGDSTAKWSDLAARVVTAAATPYQPQAARSVADAARALRAAGADAIVLDCIGYTEAMRLAAHEAAGVPVLLARALVARLAAEAVA
jgi:protein AroM